MSWYCVFMNQSKKGLFYIDMKQRVEYTLVTTVKKNKKKYSTQDVGKATLAQKLQDLTGVSAHNLIITIQSHIKN